MNYIKVFISFVIFLFLVSCNSKKEFFYKEKPEQLLSEEKFTAVFSDLILLESTVVLQSSNNTHTHKVMSVSEIKILKNHHVSKNQYIQSFDFYAQDKDKMMEIYTKILDDYNIKLSKLK